jgi:hypothetical protein
VARQIQIFQIATETPENGSICGLRQKSRIGTHGANNFLVRPTSARGAAA